MRSPVCCRRFRERREARRLDVAATAAPLPPPRNGATTLTRMTDLAEGTPPPMRVPSERTGAARAARCAIGAVAVVALLAGAAPSAAATAVVKCQQAILKSGAKLLRANLKTLDLCTTGIFTCIQTKPGDAKCLARADRKCERALVKTVGVEPKVGAAMLKTCGAVDDATLLAADGLGFDAILEPCLESFGTVPEGADGIVQCLVREYARTAQRLFTVLDPRALELLDAARVDPLPLCELSTNDSCDGCAFFPPPQPGKAVAKCGAAIAKLGSAYAAARLDGVDKCIKARFACEDAADPPACRAKAATTCAAVAAKTLAARGKLEDKVTAKCAGIDFASLQNVAGLNLRAIGVVDGECSRAGVPQLDSIEAYTQCIRRQHECEVAELTGIVAPRTATFFADAQPFPDAPCAEAPSAVAARARRVISGTAPAGIRAIIRRVVNAVTLARAAYHAGGVPVAGAGAPRMIVDIFGGRFVRPGQTNRIRITYARGGGSARAARGESSDPPTLITGVQVGDLVLDDFFELPLDADEGTLDVDVTFSDELSSCARLAFATKVDGVVSQYVPFEQVPDPTIDTTCIDSIRAGDVAAAAKRCAQKVAQEPGNAQAATLAAVTGAVAEVLDDAQVAGVLKKLGLVISRRRARRLRAGRHRPGGAARAARRGRGRFRRRCGQRPCASSTRRSRRWRRSRPTRSSPSIWRTFPRACVRPCRKSSRSTPATCSRCARRSSSRRP